ncbi:MAG: efflux RND transporter periplasmic adaptor subunit [Oceanospirillaceae bacterium]
MKALLLSVFFLLSTPSFAEDILGITEASKDVTLSLSISGLISEQSIKEGQLVQVGEKLLELDSDVEKLDIQKSLLQWKDQTELKSAQEQSAIYRTIYRNAGALFNKGAISGEEFKRKKLQYFEKRAESRKFEVKEKREEVEYKLKQAKQNLKILRAPFNGMITKIWLNKGESSEANQPLLRIVDHTQGRFITNVEETIGRTLQVGQSVNLFIKAGDEAILRKGDVVFVSPIADKASSLIECIVTFDNSDGEIKLGVTGRMEIL